MTADTLCDEMVDHLVRLGAIASARVEAAMRAVPRHVFVPEAPLEEAYGRGVVVTHRDETGRAISCASAPGTVAEMLEQLDVRPGHRILEIGAGTGYNAALLAELAGPRGQVTTVDIDAGIVAGARRGLAAAGYERVQVVHGDGAAGHAGNAPYDRIIVTAGAWDVPPAWREQLASGGRLVVPLRMRGITRSVALGLDGDVWRSVSIVVCGFIPMRGSSAVTESRVELDADGGVWLGVDDGQPIDVGALRAALTGAPSLVWSGVVVPYESPEHLDFWLAGEATRVCRVLVSAPEREVGLVAPIWRWGSMGCYTADGFAYLIRRDVPHETGQKMIELGACAYGPGAARLAGDVAGRIRAWHGARDERASLRIEVRPAGSPDVPNAMITADKTHSRVFVTVGG
ncbi:methyltransferase, FxLD system [Nonomuraea fastidiosa]|jgi:protein-L-isoaspartate(D-aspartate) O-methyltransferase|uniref:methyltransferase, FxLD system n=1 Tax=Nonomuraea fastidiosa TaxID=46173 RepID=UPI0036704071